MRHLKSGKRLGITTSHRKALMRNLITSLLEYGEIETTITKAKEMRKYFDKMIGLGKRNDLHARRQALAFVKSKKVVKKLFEEYGPLYADRNGGYTRIYRLGNRLGDNAQMALIQMVGLDEMGEKTKKDDTSDSLTKIKEELLTKEEVKAQTDESQAEETVLAEDAKKEETEGAEELKEETDSADSTETITNDSPPVSSGSVTEEKQAEVEPQTNGEKGKEES